MQYFIRQTFETEKEVAKQAEHLGTPIAHIHKLKKPRKCIIFRTVIVLSRDKQDLTLTQSCECHVKTHPWYWSLSPTSDQTEPLWTSFRMLLQNVIHNLYCWYWPNLKIVGEYNISVEAANELATFCTFLTNLQLCQCYISVSLIISSLILQTILQTIPITLLGAQTCNALLLLLTFYYYLYPECFIFWTVL